ncbi:MAG TPA: hypothetical protein DCL53_03200 [Thauera sp.]|nr:hypothetical protein [Thauera sp.]
MPIEPIQSAAVSKHPRLKPVVAAAHLTLAILLAGGALQPAQAQTAATRSQYDVPAGGLAEALVRFAQQSGVTVVVDADKVKGLRTPGLKGAYSVEDGFNALLAESGYVVGRTSAGYVLVPAPWLEGARADTLLQQVDVTAERDRADRAWQRRAEAVAERLASVTPKVIVDRSQIETLADRRVSDVAARLPGAFAGGPPGEKKSINLRGVSSEFARFSFDGVALPSSSGSRNIDLQRISSFLVEDVTYLRSPSAEHEGDGIAGRLAMRPRVIPQSSEYEVDVAAGGLDQLSGDNQSVKVGYASRFGERFGIAAAVGYDRFDTVKIKDFSERTYSGGGGPAQNLGFVIDEREPKRNESLNLFLDLAHYHAGGELHLRPLVMESSADNRKVRDRYNRVPDTFRDRTLGEGKEKIRTHGLSLEGRHTFANGLALDGSVMGSRARKDTSSLERTLNASLAFSGASASEGRVDDDARQIALNLSVPVDAFLPHRVKLGVVAREATQKNDSEVFTVSGTGERSQSAANLERSRNSDYRVRETHRAAYLQDEMQFGGLTVVPGVRVEWVDVVSSSGSGATSRRDFHDVLPSLPISYRMSDTVTLRAAVARHVNRPKLDEIAPGSVTRGNRTFRGNPDLSPARSRSVDLGFEYGKGDTMLGVNVFRRGIENLIEAREISANNFVFDNVGDGYIRGIELDQRISLAAFGLGWLDGFSIIANQAFLDSRVSDPLTGRRSFSEQPKFIGNLTLEYRHAQSGLRAAVGLSHIAKRGTLSYEGAGEIRDKTIQAQNFLDVRIERSFAGGLTLYASGENLTNQKRDEFEIRNGKLDRTAEIVTGRTYFVGLNWRM